MGKFEVGDRVRIVDQTHGWGQVRSGYEAVIQVAGDSEYDVMAFFPNGMVAQSGWTGREKCFELIRMIPTPLLDDSLFEVD
jgi:hypothetical protein